MESAQDGLNIPVPADAVADFCRRHRVREIALFGSVLRSDFTERSDVDVLIEAAPDHRHEIREILAMQDELERMFGRRVDLVYKHLLGDYIREDVLRRRRVLYVAPQ